MYAAVVAWYQALTNGFRRRLRTPRASKEFIGTRAGVEGQHQVSSGTSAASTTSTVSCTTPLWRNSKSGAASPPDGLLPVGHEHIDAYAEARPIETTAAGTRGWDVPAGARAVTPGLERAVASRDQV